MDFDLHAELLKLQEDSVAFSHELYLEDYGARELDKKLDGMWGNFTGRSLNCSL